MGYSFRKQLTLVDNVSIEESIEKAFDSLGWRYEKQDIGNYKIRLGMGMKSYGESVSITVGEKNEIFVKSKLMFGLIDWGKNKKNVISFEDSLMKNLVYLQTKNVGNNIDKKDIATTEELMFIENIIKLNKLFIAEMITTEEFKNKKAEKIKELNNIKEEINNDDFLISLIELKEKNILNQEEIISIKNIIKK